MERYETLITTTLLCTANAYQTPRSRNQKFDTPVDNFMAFRGETDAEMEAYFLSSNKIFQIDGAGKRVELGSVEGGTFVPTKTDQCWSRCYIPVLVWNPCRPVCCWCW